MSIFTKVKLTKPKKSAINLSHERKFSCNMGELVPILCQEVLPGDSFQLRLEQLVRFQALKSPMMHRVDVQTHFFFVPNRLIWNNWEEFITGGENGVSTPVFPTISVRPSSTNFDKIGGLPDYMGFPSQNKRSELIKVSQLPFRAYQLIYNEYYRDQNLTSPVSIPKGSGGLYDDTLDGKAITQLRKRAWRKDYFTSALPWAQRGPSSAIPFSQTMPVSADGRAMKLGQNDGSGNYQVRPLQQTGTTDLSNEPLYAGDIGGTTINELRRATQLQRWLEKNARGGGRYIEQILSHFGVFSDDARLQRPEYIGGGKSPVVLSEVLQQSQTSETSPQGNMAGHGVSAGSSPFFKKYFKEHGLIIGIMSVVPEPAYMQGLPKLFTKTDKFDYFFPDFQHLGEQPIQRGEIYLTGTEDDKLTFGYTPRYAEYRYIPSTVHGDMRTSLKFWHMANDYGTAPNLNLSFVECDPTHRVFAVEDKAYQKLVIQTYADIKAIRPMSKYSIPY